MPQTILFHPDENVSSSVAEGLQRRTIDVTTTPEAGLLAAADEVQLAFAQTQGRVLFTQDADFLRLHRAEVSHAGIAYCVPGKLSTGNIIRGLVLIWELLEPEEMVNRLEFL